MSNTVRWGILGTGYVARRFGIDLQCLPDAELLGVASRSATKAQEFARDLKVARWYGSYDELVTDNDVDVIYVATPHTVHRDNCVLALIAGKPVLCEKPFTVNAREAREIVQLAREENVFCMEAMRMRFMPALDAALKLVRGGAIGDVCGLMADFSIPTEYRKDSRFYNLALGGGALLDRGVYAIALAFQLFGGPEHISAEAAIGETGVDEQCAVVMRYPEGQIATLTSSLRSYGSSEAVIMGTLGRIRLDEPFFRPCKITLSKYSHAQPPSESPPSLQKRLRRGVKELPFLRYLYCRFGHLARRSLTVASPIEGEGYVYEAREVMRCLRAGHLESKIMPLDDTLSIMDTLDEIRRQWGLRYPQDDD